MKRCPTCDKTFDDNLKFCQVDGTPLVSDAEEVDPFKTMVASPADIAAAMSSVSTPEESAKADEPVLDIPESFDSGKTQVVSEAELKAEMARADADNEQVIDVPPMPEPEPPKFSEPSLTPPQFDEPAAEAEKADDAFSQTTPPIPSPFADAKPPAMEPPAFEAKEPEPPFSQPEPPSPFAAQSPESEPPGQTPQFAEPEPVYNPYEHSAPQAAEPLAQAEWTPPAAQESSMQNPQNFGQSPAAPAAGQSSVLAIVSLVSGILGLTLCCGTFIVPLVAVITGFMARGKANSDPINYGGAGLAMGGIIAGVLGLVGGIIVWILYVFYFAAIMATMQ